MNFIDFARIQGIEIQHLHASDKIQRTGTIDHPRSTNGAYFWDGEKGWAMDWAGDARPVWFDNPDAKPWSTEERQRNALRRASEASNRDKEYLRVAERAETSLKAATALLHPYFSIKGFPEEKGLVIDDKLLIPMRNVSNNKLQGYQSIRWDASERKYEKKMLYGMRSRNAVFFLGERTAKEKWLVEGFATGLTVRAALKSVGITAAVVVCFSASNMAQVADQLSGKRFIFADNDDSGTGQKAAAETGLPWTMSDIVGEDANDLQQSGGLFAVVGKIMKLRILK
jgi:phage/plasmid primase-like uncharacterized protein